MKTSLVRESLRPAFTVAEMTLRHNLVDSFVIFTALVQPMLIALLALWMLQEKGPDYAVFVVVGSGMTGLWSSLLFISGNSINVERWSGTLESLVGSPTGMSTIVFGKNLANVTQSLVSMVISYILAAWLFGYDLHLSQPLLFIGSLLLAVVAFISFGLILAPVFVMNPGVQHWQNAMEFPVFILSGFLFPIALLPGWTSPFSYVLPPYWAARALHGASSGSAGVSEILFAWLMLVVFSALSLAVASRLFKKMLTKARTDATLEME